MGHPRNSSARWIFLWILFIIVLGMLATGCGNNVEADGTGFGEHIKVVEVDKHEYVVYDGYQGGGIVHKANCNARH